METNNGNGLELPALQRQRRALVVMDVVESVRLMEANETDVIERWRRFVGEVRTQVLPQHGGRLVRSLGDGLLLEFEKVPAAVAAALEIQRRVAPYNAHRSANAAIHLRGGVHVAEVVVDDLDIYGPGVNLAARLASLAAPSRLVGSVAVRDAIVPSLDAEITDLGWCYLKHYEDAVRAYQLDPVGTDTLLAQPLVATYARKDVLPVLAVTAVHAAQGDVEAMAIESAITDDLIAALSRCPFWHVVAALSAAALAGRRLPPLEVGRLLQAGFVLMVSAQRAGSERELVLELLDVSADCTIWAQSMRLRDGVAHWARDDLAQYVGTGVMQAIVGRVTRIQHEIAVPNTPSYALLLQAVTLLHRTAPDEADTSRRILEQLIDRHPLAPDVHAWRGKWYIAQVIQKAVDNVADFQRRAGASLARSLECAPGHALALTLQGHCATLFERDCVKAEAYFRQALAAKPSEPLAWLLLSYVLAARDAAQDGVRALETAMRLSPFDPMPQMFDSFAAAVYGAAGAHERALTHASRAVRFNATHLPSLAQLIICQVAAQQVDEARQMAARYLVLRPTASVKRYEENHQARGSTIANREAQALLTAGIPP
jgi:adenylate cyclase